MWKLELVGDILCPGVNESNVFMEKSYRTQMIIQKKKNLTIGLDGILKKKGSFQMLNVQTQEAVRELSQIK